jgi:hypothetical protein
MDELPTFLDGGGGASECLEEGRGGDVVDFLVTTRLGVSPSRCWMEWFWRVFRPAILEYGLTLELRSTQLSL